MASRDRARAGPRIKLAAVAAMRRRARASWCPVSPMTQPRDLENRATPEQGQTRRYCQEFPLSILKYGFFAAATRDDRCTRVKSTSSTLHTLLILLHSTEKVKSTDQLRCAFRSNRRQLGEPGQSVPVEHPIRRNIRSIDTRLPGRRARTGPQDKKDKRQIDARSFGVTADSFAKVTGHLIACRCSRSSSGPTRTPFKTRTEGLAPGAVIILLPPLRARVRGKSGSWVGSGVYAAEARLASRANGWALC